VRGESHAGGYRFDDAAYLRTTICYTSAFALSSTLVQVADSRARLRGFIYTQNVEANTPHSRQWGGVFTWTHSPSSSPSRLVDLGFFGANCHPEIWRTSPSQIFCIKPCSAPAVVTAVQWCVYRLKFHLARLDSTRLDTFDFVEPVEPVEQVETSVSSETSRAVPAWRTTNDLVQV